MNEHCGNSNPEKAHRNGYRRNVEIEKREPDDDKQQTDDRCRNFLVKINDLQINTLLYKYVDDCSTYEIISRSFPNSSLQANINTIYDWTNHNNMRLNVSKTKEMRISFLRYPSSFGIRLTYVAFFSPSIPR
jgi:hypothetical protein